MRYVELGRDNLRSHFVFRPRHAPEWLRARFLPVIFLANEEELTGKTFTTPLNTTNPNTYVKFIFLRTSPLRGARRDPDTNDIFAHCSLTFYFVEPLFWKKCAFLPHTFLNLPWTGLQPDSLDAFFVLSNNTLLPPSAFCPASLFSLCIMSCP